MGINDIPDEMLLMILAFVPYQACEGLTTLKLVNKRFLAITQMHSLKCQTIENQFAEIAAIYGLDDAVRMENIGLQGAAELTEEVNEAVKKLSLVGDKAVHRCMLEYGVILLDTYLTITEQFLIQDKGIDQRMIYGLNRPNSITNPPCWKEILNGTVTNAQNASFRVMGIAGAEHHDFRDLIIEGILVEDEVDVGMISQFCHVLAIGTTEHELRALLEGDAAHEAQVTRLEYMEGYRWRILSLPDQTLREIKAIDNVSTPSTPVEKEYTCDRDTRGAFDKMTICEIINHLNPRFLREARDLLEDEAEATLAGKVLHGLTMPESLIYELEILVTLT
ncbi:hypothetical protein LTS08_007102 [Lithohypha guttulata]|nr:hypothetical protein LTS08_007102 [Lithohypha guttulata]